MRHIIILSAPNFTLDTTLEAKFCTFGNCQTKTGPLIANQRHNTLDSRIHPVLCIALGDVRIGPSQSPPTEGLVWLWNSSLLVFNYISTNSLCWTLPTPGQPPAPLHDFPWSPPSTSSSNPANTTSFLWLLPELLLDSSSKTTNIQSILMVFLLNSVLFCLQLPLLWVGFPLFWALPPKSCQQHRVGVNILFMD